MLDILKRIRNIKIGDLNYIIEFSEPKYDKNLKDAWAYIKDTRIVILKDIPDNIKLEALIHEVIHGIESEYGIQLSEKEVKALSKGLYNFLLDIKWFLNLFRRNN
jgi:hypothetical protein